MKKPIQNFETNELTMDEFLKLVLENGLDYNVEWDESKYIITLNNINKQIKIVDRFLGVNRRII